ncbi:alpha/beta hydrolase [Phanerochaete sordida]|uniref:Alpha/beta hydrolase n=1 Tax=Phanerochaete sordida TaxID=48140 RepID=A0A9P3G9X7_9APHY|nr:alpha/beta hydrolase [Phanerochaete sordida]
MDGKQFAQPARPFEQRKRRTSYTAFAWRVIMVIGLLAFAQVVLSSLVGKYDALRSPKQGTRSVSDDPELIWNKVPPSSVDKVFWTSCYDGKQCARLMVPLDYAVPDGPKAGVALIKVPSKLSARDTGYRGPILFNPGGPGGSGVAMVANSGDKLQRLIGDDFDIVGFDPRGVARTTPPVVVFKNNAEEAAWRLRVQDDPSPNTTADAVSRLWAKAQVLGSIANQTTARASPYVSTALVARDMLNIMQAHGYDKIQYWGFSYGTILGSTFAAMFPDNVGRLIIDGVADAENYYAGLWSNNLLDTDEALKTVLDACVAAGPSLCALYEPSTKKVHARLTAIFDALKKRPLPVYNNITGKEYGLIDYKIARRALFARLYSPYGSTLEDPTYPAMELLEALAQAEKGDGLALGRRMGTVPAQTRFSCSCPSEPRPPLVATPDTITAISCSDAGFARAGDTIEDLEAHFVKMRADSEFADQWPFRVSCSGWKVKSVERFEGPFVANTSFPMLIIGNTADPVTPLTHARKMSQGFNNSVVLHQDSAGHCSLAATSICTAKAIREYFREGKLPKNGTVCGVESTIFPSYSEAQSVEALQGEDRKIVEAWRELRGSFEVPKFGMAI